MIPQKGKKYAIAYVHPNDAARNYSGVATCNGELDGFEDEIWYGFTDEKVSYTLFFAAPEILAEVK